MGRKQAVGWMLIAVAGILSASLFTQAMVERSVVPETSPEDTPVAGLVPLDED